MTELLEQYSRPALALARRIVLDDRVAEDVVQEAFLSYWRNPAAFVSGRGAFGSWFLALVHHKAVDAVRHEQSLRRRADAVALQLDPDAELGPDVAEVVAERMAGAAVRRALEALPAEQREVLVLAYWGGCTQREIAQHTGVPLGTVKSRMAVGMKRLHAALDKAVLPVAATG